MPMPMMPQEIVSERDKHIVGPDAAKRAEYTDAAAKFQQAAALTSLEDAPRAVALYADAEKGYRAAGTASTHDPAVFVQKATDA